MDSSRQPTGEEPSGNAIREIRELIAQGARLLADADSTSDLRALAVASADAVYDEEIVVIGEGLESPIRGREAVIELLHGATSTWGPGSRVTTEIVEPVYASATLASMIVQVTVLPAAMSGSVLSYRAMYTFRRGPRGWRMVLESFASAPV